MSSVLEPAESFLVVGLFATGFAAIFFFADRQGRSTRALSLNLALIGLRLLLTPWERTSDSPVLSALLCAVVEVGSILAGMEWVRRVAETATQKLGRTINALLRAAQILVLVYGGLMLGYILLAPEQATSDLPGLFRVRALEWAVFAPVLGTAALLAGLAIAFLLFTRTDPVESIRLRALLLAAPFFFSGLVISQSLIPLLMSVGLLIYLAGAVRYLIVLGQRGQFMGQFLAPEVARVLRVQGMEQVLRRERRMVSALFCDLRGFTAYTQERSSEDVMNLLERYYEAVGAAAAEQGGTVKDHAGDGVLVLFGAPVAQKDHAGRAVGLGLALVEQVLPQLRQWAPGLGLGVGIASGVVSAGAIRGAGRLEYVAVGPAINLAARLCQRAGDGELLLDQSSRQPLDARLGVRFTVCEALAMKGFEDAVRVHRLRPDASP